MSIPIAYNIRSLAFRRTTTLMTALGIALSVTVLVASLSLVNGLRTVFRNSANPLHLLVLRRGVSSELGSAISTETFQQLRVKSGIALDTANRPMASEEIVNVGNLPSVDNPNGMNVTVRGLSEIGIEMRNVRIAQGRWFTPGQREISVGRSVSQRYPSAKIGNKIRFGRGDWLIVGVMNGADSAVDSEIWGDLNQISGDYNRQDTANSVLVRATDATALDALKRSIADDPQIGAIAITQSAYYESQTASGAPLEFLGIFVAVMMAVGSGFAATNIMYAEVIRRTKDIGTLRTLGFSEGAILLSFLSESMLLAVLAGIVGCVLAFPLDLVTTGIGSLASFSEISFRFRVGVSALLAGMIFSLVVGLIGGFWPARMAAKKAIVSALRES